jgi:hypothetical protein
MIEECKVVQTAQAGTARPDNAFGLSSIELLNAALNAALATVPIPLGEMDSSKYPGNG